MYLHYYLLYAYYVIYQVTPDNLYHLDLVYKEIDNILE